MVDCKDKRFLVVESIKQSRDTLRLFAYSIGAERVDISHQAKDVFSMCEYVNYDIILLGYDLGHGKKNGQQILEELREKNLISRHCIIIMITAEISQAMVLAALEHKPDEYLTKPYTLKDISHRVNRSLAKKKAMHDIYVAMDDADHKQVLSLCEKIIISKSAFKEECLGIQSRQYFELQEFSKAEQIYNKYRGIEKFQWATIGLGKIALIHKDFENAKAYFQEVIDSSPYYLSAYDWLAKALLLDGENLTAEKTLEQALLISPLSVTRLKSYAEICLTNENYDKATDAFFRTNELAYHSIHKHPENAIKFAEALLEYSDDLDIYQTKKLNNRAYKALNTMTKDFNTAEYKIISHLLNARLHNKVNEHFLANNLLNNAMTMLGHQSMPYSAESTLTISSSLKSLQKNQEAQKLLLELAHSQPDNSNLLAKIEGLLDNPITEKAKEDAQEALQIGVNLYQQHHYQLAIDKLNKALTLFPTHIGIKLNLLQVLIVSIEQDTARNQDRLQVDDLIESFEILSSNSEAYRRYSKLKHKYLSLTSISK